MAQISFMVQGVGYDIASLGCAYIALWWNGVPLLYEASPIQNTAGSPATSCVSSPSFLITNDLTGQAPESLLSNFANHVVEFKLENVGMGMGHVSFSLKIFTQNQGSPIYQVERRPNVRGINSGSVTLHTTFRRLHVDLSYHRPWTVSRVVREVSAGIQHAPVMSIMTGQERNNFIFREVMNGRWLSLTGAFISQYGG